MRIPWKTIKSVKRLSREEESLSDSILYFPIPVKTTKQYMTVTFEDPAIKVEQTLVFDPIEMDSAEAAIYRRIAATR